MAVAPSGDKETGGRAPGNIDWREISQRSPFQHQDLAPPKSPQAPMLEHLRPNNQQDKNTAIDRLPKVVLSSQPPQNTPRDKDLPTRGTRPNSTDQRASTSPSHQEACTSPWINLTHQKQEELRSCSLQKGDHKDRK